MDTNKWYRNSVQNNKSNNRKKTTGIDTETYIHLKQFNWPIGMRVWNMIVGTNKKWEPILIPYKYQTAP